MSRLDDIADLNPLDPGGMYHSIAGFPDQINEAVAIAEKFQLNPDSFYGIENIILCGMGGSAIGGDLARTLLSSQLKIPFYICRSYNLPGFAGEKSLVVGSSYSGNTEETLSAFRQALELGCKTMIVTTGGQLLEIAQKNDIPAVLLPGGLQPRAALGYSFAPIMLALNKIGLSEYSAVDFRQLADFLKGRITHLEIETDSDQNHAKQLAMRLYGRIPIIYTGPELFDVVGTRLKGQICENAKMLAFNNQFPEFNHNELVGWKVLNSFRDYLRVLIIRDEDDHPRVAARMDIVKEVIKKTGVDVFEIKSEGDNRLQRIFSLIQLGDFLSFYLAILNKVDPTPVEPIETLKKELAKIQ